MTSNAPPPPPPPPPPRPGPPKPPASLTPEAKAFMERRSGDVAAQDTVHRAVDRMVVMKGVFTTGASLLAALLGPVALSLTADAATKSNSTLPGFTVPFVQHPWLLSVIALPAIACGVMMIVTKRHRWLAMTISTLILLLLLLIVLVAFVSMMSAVYSGAMKPL